MAQRTPASEAELRRYLKRDTGSEPTQPEWEYLRDLNLVAGALDDQEEDGYACCLEQLQIFRKWANQEASQSERAAARGGHEKKLAKSLVGVATAKEVERCRVLSLHFARLADRWPVVQIARRMLLGDPRATLSVEEALDLLESPAMRFLSPEFFKERGVPVLGHHSVARVVALRTIKGRTLEDVEIAVLWAGGSVRERKRVERYDLLAGRSPRFIELPRRDGPVLKTEVYPGSFMWGVAVSAAQIAAIWWWSELEATWFILTGTVPQMAPVRAHFKTIRGEDAKPTLQLVELRTFPFVSARTMYRAQAAVRRWTQRKKGTRSIDASNLRLYDFVEARRGDQKATPKWSKLMREWNHSVKDRGRYNHRGNFRNDYLRVRRLLTVSDFDRL